MLKPVTQLRPQRGGLQPPSGGCVLKRCRRFLFGFFARPAAFRRLCVETSMPSSAGELVKPAAFRRLCVETA